MPPAQPDGASTTPRVAASFVCTLLSVVYMLQLKPQLQAAGVVCVEEAPTEAVDWVIIAALASHGFAIQLAVRRKYSLLIVLLAFAVATLRLNVLVWFFGPCALTETTWCVMLGGLALTALNRAQPDKPRGGVSLQVAEAEVAKILARLEAVAWSDDGTTTGGLEHGGSNACAICLGDWEAGDAVRVTPCGHAFHQDCLKDWLVSSMCKWQAQSCAVCRRDLGLLAGAGDDGAVAGQISSPRLLRV